MILTRCKVSGQKKYMGKYIHGERQIAKIVQAGIELWHEGGASAVTARGIGKRVGLSHAGVLFHFQGIAGLRWEVKCAAIEAGDTKIIPQLITAQDDAVAHFTDEQRRQWLSVGAG